MATTTTTFDAATRLAEARAKQERLSAEVADLHHRLPALRVEKEKGNPRAFDEAQARLDVLEQQLRDVALLIEGLGPEVDAETRRRKGIDRLVQLYVDARENFTHLKRDLMSKGASRASHDLVEKVDTSFRTWSALGSDLYGLTNDRHYQVRSGLRQELGDELWTPRSPYAPKSPIVKSRQWIEALAMARGEAAPTEVAVVEEGN